MIILNNRRRHFLKLETVYFSDNPKDFKSNADIVLFYLTTEKRKYSRTFYTLRFDLLKTEEELFKNVKSNFRQSINKIQRDYAPKISEINNPSPKDIMLFSDNYYEFSSAKKIEEIDLSFLKIAAKAGCLKLNFLYNDKGDIVCGTANIHDDKTILCMYAFSHFRKYNCTNEKNLIGSFNKYLFWSLIKSYKKQGFDTFDFGGLGMGKESSDLDKVDNFKMGFGGDIVTLYHFYQPKSFLGWIVTELFKLNRRIKY